MGLGNMMPGDPSMRITGGWGDRFVLLQPIRGGNLNHDYGT